jgi:putative salt-induced outer membrane protein
LDAIKIFKDWRKMMKILYTATVAAVLIGVGPTAGAAEKNWSDQAELSYVETGGNSDTATLSFKNELIIEFSDRLAGIWKLGALSSHNDGIRNAESYFTELRGDYLLTERWYAYLNAGWAKDTFAGLDSRIYAGPGAGYKLLAGPRHFLAAEMGLNYTTEEYTDDTEEDFIAGRLFGKYEFAFNETNNFSQSLEYLHNFDESDDYKIISESAVTSALSTNYSLKVSYTVKYDHMPVPASLDDTDTILAAALVANF